ncbi:DUF6518 family protein [Streptomyces sp. 549]|uniref:DUF6518 family protein n=1 Tax=Streptomyces sp. 549 TaxID=3049076 RepID=UPI0024C3638C|nr:DUF6518 family protein [Streptomyces sp. 549]MDK1472525.1 DUF6518 family protein [Streptomyces sp. 549]
MTTTAPDHLAAAPTAGPLPWRSRAVAATLGGLLLGVLTNLAQGWLPGAWNQIANSGAVWAAAAFAAGALLFRQGPPLRAAIGGAGAELGLVLGYYGYAEFVRGGAGGLLFPLVWLGMALVAGPLFGVAGLWWRSSRDTRRRVAALAAFAGLFGMEGLTYALDLRYAPQAWACLAVFTAIPLLMARTHRERATTLGAAAVCALLAYVLVALPLQAVSA